VCVCVEAVSTLGEEVVAALGAEGHLSSEQGVGMANDARKIRRFVTSRCEGTEESAKERARYQHAVNGVQLRHLLQVGARVESLHIVVLAWCRGVKMVSS
jgi:hypothetical protein